MGSESVPEFDPVESPGGWAQSLTRRPSGDRR